jgi:hypothetical protein
MNVKLCQIKVDEETATLLEARAEGMTVSELLADFASNYEVLPSDLAEMRDTGGPGRGRTASG